MKIRYSGRECFGYFAYGGINSTDNDFNWISNDVGEGMVNCKEILNDSKE